MGHTVIEGHKKSLLCLFNLNPIRAGGGRGGGPLGPSLVFFYPHISCVRARDLKFYDFLNNIKTNLEKLFFGQKVHFCGHRAHKKMVKKGLIAF